MKIAVRRATIYTNDLFIALRIPNATPPGPDVVDVEIAGNRVGFFDWTMSGNELTVRIYPRDGVIVELSE